MTGDERFEIIRTSNSIGGIKNMCEVLDRVENRGIKKGIEKGIEKANIETAIKMINKDYSLEEIHELTNLSLKQIKELQLANK